MDAALERGEVLLKSMRPTYTAKYAERSVEAGRIGIGENTGMDALRGNDVVAVRTVLENGTWIFHEKSISDSEWTEIPSTPKLIRRAEAAKKLINAPLPGVLCLPLKADAPACDPQPCEIRSAMEHRVAFCASEVYRLRSEHAAAQGSKLPSEGKLAIAWAKPYTPNAMRNKIFVFTSNDITARKAEQLLLGHCPSPTLAHRRAIIATRVKGQ